MTTAYLRSAGREQAQRMLDHLISEDHDAVQALAGDALGALARRPDVQVRMVEDAADSATDGHSGCFLAGHYDDGADPPCLVVARSLSLRRQQFTVLHEFGHHLQQTVLALGQALDLYRQDDLVEEAACDHFAAAILIPDEVTARLIGTRGPRASDVRALYETTRASRAACCVVASTRLAAAGAVVLYRPDGTVDFAATKGGLAPPARGSDQSATALVQAALAAPETAADITRRTTIAYRDGSRSHTLYGQATWCDGYLVAVLADSSPAWEALAIPYEDRQPAHSRWHQCTHCPELALVTERCSSCRQPRCSLGHCSCTGAQEQHCSACFMLVHRSQFPAGSTLCSGCLE